MLCLVRVRRRPYKLELYREVIGPSKRPHTLETLEENLARR